MKGALCLVVLFITGFLSANTAPLYQISNINGNVVTFSNDAVFNVYYENFFTLQGWDIGDSVELVSTEGIIFPPHQIKKIDGHFEICPIFLLRNITKSDEQIASWLEVAPPAVHSPDTFLVSSIDYVNRIISLNNSTSWVYSEEDQLSMGIWSVGDIVMMGINNFSSISNYDFILLNTAQENMVRIRPSP